MKSSLKEYGSLYWKRDEESNKSKKEFLADPEFVDYKNNNRHLELSEVTRESLEKLFKDIEDIPMFSTSDNSIGGKTEFKEEAHKDPFQIGEHSLQFEEEFGGESKGEDYWVVFSVTSPDKKTYWKWDGWYASYDGGYLENLFQVEPKEVTVIQWDKV